MRFLSIRQAGLSQLAGVGGKGGWAWIFIIEGLITVVAGVISFFIIQDFPDTAKFLSEAERAFVIRRLQADDQFSAAGEELRWKYIFKSILDWKTWVGSACLISHCFLLVPLPYPFVWDCRGFASSVPLDRTVLIQ